MSIVEAGFIGALVLIYAGSGAVELLLWRRFVDRFARWGYPRPWAIITPSLKLLGGVLVVLDPTRRIGAALCAIISIAATVSVLRVRDRSAYVPALVIMALTVAGAAFLIRRS